MSAPSRAYKTRAIVLRSRNLGEADRILTLFSEARGKLDAVAKGARRTKSHVMGRLEFASEALFGMHRGRHLDIITSAELVRSRWSTVVDPASYAAAHLMIELVDAFCEPDLALPEIYALLDGALQALGRAIQPAELVPRFELRLLAVLGLAPAADECVRCGGALDDRAAWLDLEAGGLACESCRPHHAHAYPLEPGEVENFRALATERGAQRRAAVHATPGVARAIEAFVAYQLGKRPKSSALLLELAHGASGKASPAASS